MRHSRLLIGAAALALLAGTGMALSQGAHESQGPAVNQQQGGGKAGNTQREGPAAQPGRAQSERRGNDATTGQAPSSNQGQSQRSQRDQAQPQRREQAQPQNSEQRSGQSERGKAGNRDETTGQQPRQQNQAPAAQQQSQPQQGQSKSQNPETQGQAGARVTFTTEQRTRIRETVIRASNAPRATNVNFTISVGTAVPRTVRLAPLPTLIVDVEPVWRGYMYFIVNDEIIVVEPNSLKIVAVLDV
jgi:hypothetical protein